MRYLKFVNKKIYLGYTSLFVTVCCPAGMYYDLLSTTCKECNISSYQNEDCQFSCTQCGGGKITPKRGCQKYSDCIGLLKIVLLFHFLNYCFMRFL